MYNPLYNCAACGGYKMQQQYSAPAYQSSSLEYAVNTESLYHYKGSSGSSNAQKSRVYETDASSFTYQAHIEEYFTPKNHQYHAAAFLKQYRPATQFVDNAKDIEGFVKEIFEKTMGKNFPENIVVHVLDEEEMKTVHTNHGGSWCANILGFSVNKVPMKQVFVKNAHLDQVLAVVGHEIGHVLTPSLPVAHDEEAKAFAFEHAWVQAIIENNIANLKENFTLAPAANGLHDVASAFVKKLLKSGREALEIYGELARRVISIID